MTVRAPASTGEAADLDHESIAPPHGGRTTADSFVAGYGLLILLLWVPSLSYPFSTPRLMLGLLVTGPGLVLLVRLAVHRDLPAILLSAFLGCAVISALLSRAPVESSFGILSDRSSALALAMLGASWALGRQASPAGVRLLSGAVVLGVGMNGAVALLQVLAEPVGVLALAEGRAAAFTPNPIVLGGLVIGALAMLGFWAPRSSRWLISLPLAFALGLVGNITGTRAALAIGLVMVALPSILRRDPRGGGDVVGAGVRPARSGWPRLASALLLAGAVVLGAVASMPFETSTSAVGRTEGDAGAGITPRRTMWTAGLGATVERPVLGWGPGQFRTATSPRTTAAFVRAEGPDKLFFDAHNLVIEILVTTGVLGLAVAGAFAYSCFRRARGALGWFALGLACSLLLSPIFALSGILLMLVLGAAMAGGGPPWRSEAGAGSRSSRWWGAAMAGLLVLSGTWGALHVRADYLASRGVDTLDAQDVADAQRFIPPDLELADLERSLRAEQVLGDDTVANRQAALRSARRVVRVDSRAPHGWAMLGTFEALYGAGTRAERIERAEAAYRRSLSLDPWSVTGARGMWMVAREREDQDQVRYWRDRLCAVDQCPSGDGLPPDDAPAPPHD